MLSDEEFAAFKAERGQQDEQIYDTKSLLDFHRTIQYQAEQSVSDKAANVWHSFWNGVKSVGRGTAQGLLANQYDNYVHAEETPAEVTDDDADLDSLLAKQLAGRDAMTAVANSDFLKPREVRAESAIGQYAYNAVEGIGQLGAQAFMAAIPGIGEVAAPASMYYQILGSEYDELRAQGVDHDTAYTAAQANAVIQSPMEYLSLTKMMKRIPANTVAGRKFRMFVDKVLTEVGTEALQQLPEDISKIYAMNPEKTASEIASMAWDQKAELFGNMVYAGFVAAPAALLGGGINMAVSRNEINRAIQREIYNESMEHVESTVNRIKETGVNPAYAAAVVNDNMQNQNVYVDGEALYGYAQEKGIEKVAESLGVSVDTIEKAAADGNTIDVNIGNFEATSAAFDGFLDAVKDDTAFEDGGYTVNKDRQEQAWAAAKKQQEDAVRTELDRIEGEMKEAAKAAGIKADVTKEMINLLSRARMWSNPAEVLKKLSFRYGESAEGYAQFAGENAETADKVKLAEAQQMEADGKAADEIYKQTGWFKGLDNKWRFEVADNLNDVDLSGIQKLGELPLARVYYNEALFNAYPILRTVKVKVDPNMEENTNGEADVVNFEIALNGKHIGDDAMKSTLVHEVAHLIQTIENFAAGGSADDVRDALKTLGQYKQEYDNLDNFTLYERIGGEQEAREVARRARLEQNIAALNERIEEAKKNGNDEEVRRATFAKAILKRQKNQMPTPHTSDALIVFDDIEIPYSQSQSDISNSYLQAAWHGSPHKFVKFDLGAIGTGEGAQVHGWGLYFAQNREIAKGYKERLQMEGPGKITIDGDVYEYYGGSWDNKSRYEYLEEWQYRLLDVIAECNGDKEKIREQLNREIQSGSEVYKEALEYFDEMEEIQFEESSPGSLFQVDIPDNDVLLDEQKTFEEQPEKVQEALRKLFLNNGLATDVDGTKAVFLPTGESYLDEIEGKTGREIYKDIATWETDGWGEWEVASKLLNEYGIKGITYDGKQDGRCYVVFDDQAINIIDTYNKQVNGTTKGNYNPNTNIITLFKGADASTVIHETWHFFVEQMWQTVQDGTASEQTVKDFETLLNYAGMTMEEWASADIDGRRKAHEKLAEAGETYIMEGKAPSHELRHVFDKFAKWLKDVYRTLQRSENYAELTDEVREVFDRMLAAEDDIAEMERINGYFSKLPDVITDNMSDETRAKVEDYIAKAREKAVYILTRRALKDYSKKRRDEVKKFKEEIRPRVEEEVSKRPVYACGYDKADAARFRMLRDQQAGIGIWTADDFIDRAFASDVSEVQNEVAHLAAAMNPKNWKKGISDLRADYIKQRDEILQPALDALGKGMGQGVDIVQQEDRDGRGVRVSNNAQWYRDFFAEHKRKPNKKELQEMARLLVSGDTNAPKVEGWTATSADVAQAMAAEGERLADIERHIEACEEIKDRLGRLNENYNETSAAGSERFLLEANMTAEQYGYSSADEMMQDIEQSPTQARAVNQRINEIVAEMSTENEKENYENAIRESLYNEDEALLIGVEQQLIAEYAERAKERQAVNEQRRAERKEQAKINAQVAAARKQQAKNLAQADLSRMNMKEATRTSKYITAERNAAVKCAQLLAKKKFDEALTQKNLQAYWHAMAAESIKIARRQKQYQKFIKTQVKLKPEAWLNETHFAAISQIFTRMGIARPVHRQAAESAEFQTLAAYAAAMKEQFDCVDIPLWILEGKIPISDTNALTLEQYEDVVNTIKNIKAIVKAQKGVNMFSTQEAWTDTKAHIMGLLAPLKTLWEPNPNKVSKPSKKEQWLAGLETMDTVCEMLDGGRYGWFSQHWNNLIKRCQDREYDHRKAYDDAETEAYKKWVPDKSAEAAANEEVYYEELGTSVTKHTLVRMLMNLGNKENSQRICETVLVGFEKSTLWVMPDESLAANQKELRAMREEAREATRKNLIDFLGKVLTEEDVKYAQRRINAMEMFWGERVELDKRTKGFAPKKVEATPVLLDIGGKQVVLQGGYCPLLRYGETGSHSAAQEVNEDEPLQGKNIRTYHTNTSSSKARTNARYPVDLRLGTERNWIYESIHDICWREAMTDFRRVLNDQELFGTLKSKMGLSRMNLFKELLEVSADGRNSKPLSEFEKSISETAGWLTSRTTNALVMCSLKISNQNLADCFLYGNAVEGYTMADNISALGRYMLCFNFGKWKEMQDFVFSKSAYMEERSLIPDVTIRDMMADEKEKKWQKVLRETTTKMLALTDNATAIPNWMQAYNKKINEGWAEQDAIDFADTVVRRVKGSSRNTEISSMQRSKVLKPITMFQSFFNARFNEFVRMERYATNQWTDGQKAEAFSTVASYVMAKVIAQAMLALALAAENPFGIDDEDKWPNLIKELKSQTFSMFGPIGQAASAAVGAAAGMREFDYRMSAIESTVNKGIGAIKAVRSDKKTAAEKVEAATNFATLVSGAPMQITRIFWNAFDIVFNNMSPEIGDIMRRRPKNERK